jgi:hypothetical protein
VLNSVAELEVPSTRCNQAHSERAWPHTPFHRIDRVCTDHCHDLCTRDDRRTQNACT